MGSSEEAASKPMSTMGLASLSWCCCCCCCCFKNSNCSLTKGPSPSSSLLLWSSTTCGRVDPALASLSTASSTSLDELLSESSSTQTAAPSHSSGCWLRAI